MKERTAAHKDSHLLSLKVDEDEIRTLKSREKFYCSAVLQQSFRSLSKNCSQSTRCIIVEWFYKIVDYFEHDRDIVAISLDLLDRYYILSNEEFDEKRYQLTSMTSLYIALKMNYSSHGKKSFSLQDCTKLSRGQFDAEDLEAMELRLFETLDWKLNPVIPTDYLVPLLSLMNCSDSRKTLEQFSSLRQLKPELQYSLTIIYEVARYLIEIAIGSQELNFYQDSFRIQSPSLLCLGAIIQILSWVSDKSIPSCLKTFFVSRSTCLLQVKNCEHIHSIKNIMQRSLVPESTIEDLPPDSVKEVLANIHPFILLRNANVLDRFAFDTFITTILSSKNNRKRKQPCSPTSIIGDKDIYQI